MKNYETMQSRKDSYSALIFVYIFVEDEAQYIGEMKGLT